MNAVANPWPRRTAVAAAVLTFPLLLLGGTVTTLRVGMSVPDWPTTFGHNMFTYPLRDMLANQAVFWEHTHRLFGSLVGLAAIAMVVAHVRFERRASVRWLAVAALVTVVAQGVLGGLRVLDNSEGLAFLHGAVAQAVFALIGAVAVVQSRPWTAASACLSAHAVPLRRIALATTVLVYAQIVVGAWLRHSGNMNALGLHIVLAAAATAAVVLLARELKRTAHDGSAMEGTGQGHDRAHLLLLRQRLLVVVSAQLVLGLLAAVWVYLVTGPHNPVSVGEAIFATAHVGIGALLLLWCVASVLWSHGVVTEGAVKEGAVTGTPADTGDALAAGLTRTAPSGGSR
jgi:cytochrome c oxidase assembly protein subunit 15